MFVAAAAGARVAKHGGRSVSSHSGSADVLEALGANIDADARAGRRSASHETGIGFMFAPNHHPPMKHAAPVRKELGVRTIFNILGPLTNPAGAPNQLMGVFHPDLVGIQVRVLQRLGSRARAGGLRHERPGRDLAVGRDAGRRAEGRRGPRVRRPPERLRAAGVRLAGAQGGEQGGVGGSASSARWRTRTGRCATSCCSTPARRSTAAGVAALDRRRASSWRARPWRRARRAPS